MFTCKITEVQHLNYWERLHELKLYSLQRRRERYIIIYIWNITQHMVLNIDGTIGHTIKTRNHPRHGTQCLIQYPTNRNPAQSLQENAITVFGPRLYNSLPKYLRDIEIVKYVNLWICRAQIQIWARQVSRHHSWPAKNVQLCHSTGSNSILDQLTHLRAQGIYNSGGVPDSALEQS